MSNLKTHLDETQTNRKILEEMYEALNKNLLEKWYPLAIDNSNGGYFTEISYDFKLEPVQHKMVVTQARHVWTASKAALFFNNKVYEDAARHGFDFLRNCMWDINYGGFYQMRDEKGLLSDYLGFLDEKRTYGNAFGLYALASLFELTHQQKVLDFAIEVFEWIEHHCSDTKMKGYFQFIDPKGNPFDRNSYYKSKAYDIIELGYKDQNSSIHLLEAYTELYNVWHNYKLREILYELLLLIRDVITTPLGFMNLFFHYDWTPLSFKEADKKIIEKNYRLDHVSFGHDYETGFLMLEASYSLGLNDDIETLLTAKRMVDHAIANGWDDQTGGFWDAGYYFEGDNHCSIIQHTKNWWAQAEGLNILLIMSNIFPENYLYREYFLKQWDYIKNYLLDYQYGDWFEGGLDREPHLKTGPKGHIWKCNYHTARALMNCIKILSNEDFFLAKESEGFKKQKQSFNEFLEHWKNIARLL